MNETESPRIESLRLFTAIELPEEWIDALTRVRAELDRASGGRLKTVRPELIHLTLVFLGNQAADTLPTITEALATAAAEASPFILALGRPGYFGQPYNIQAIWVGLGATPPGLQQLYSAIAIHLAESGVSFDRKPLVPHITIARGRRPADRNASLQSHAAIQRIKLPSGLTHEAEEFVLMESHLDPSGPEYRVVERFSLQ
jgi:RNA 2',3'-cyclic 3'-phosphodiesterase